MNNQEIIKEIKRFIKISKPYEFNSNVAKSYGIGKIDAYKHILRLLGAPKDE